MIMTCQYYKNQICSSCCFTEKTTLIEKKSEFVQKAFLNLPITFPPPHFSNKDQPGFRNKAKLAVFGTTQNPSLGITTSDLVQKDISHCPLYLNGIQKLIPQVKNIIGQLDIPIYDIKTRTGELKYIIIVGSSNSKEHMLRFVLKSKQNLDNLKKAVSSIILNFPTIKVVSANIQPIPHAIVEGLEEIILTPQTHITETLSEYQLYVSPKCFFQTNPSVAISLYLTFQKWLSETNAQNALDLYCGTGCFSFFAAKHLDFVYGVEITPDAIHCALKSKSLNRFTNTEFINDDATSYFNHSTHQFDTLIVNPPRKGLGADLAKMIATREGLTHLYYSSCNAETLVKDFEILKFKFTPTQMAIFDMFPFTRHYECLIEFKALSAG
ncbi:MAG: hypothetical protein A2381_18560 [Bdellovibrionales bacterium RIFOXYB1_FULL_37_110]|nr:MAG: hypothetical protein A2417_01210 [Bdellovibrionales bacterium RIFOXYC1_FULL_37_79]OFZ59032.1 MAG: hypothetical protein A2381_18560 [Bdellovibrionales bacterium RIFOXYB1_FULL_37_110]OFZ65137.1 MAG: hypothetical protein A2577_04875 [Bdellovibrionales bacterium RIFOXYD1_FULL_36_51]